ncbi:MAG TPA: substrate-binding domain-containing protein [Candidatus Brachybacterium merdigallinarum]|jgi:DNA-binding LacI/PurR family transcriptional regulator/biotin operon repressor|nr:substrate-binding domain-containing protein [Candidatus Brachybacterium merdigallinarum]
MFKNERQQAIVRALQESGSVRVAELAEMLKSSRATIWRDIDELGRRGVVSKVHGGATLTHPLPTGGIVQQSLELAPPQPGLVIGLQVPESLYYFGPIITGAKRACELAGAELKVGISGYQDDDIREEAAILHEAGVDGLLLTPSFAPSKVEETCRWITDLDLPVVLVERESPGLGIPGARTVSTSREAGTHAAMAHLKLLGHENVGLISVNERVEPMRRVIDGWQIACRDLGLNTELTEPPLWIADDSKELVDAIVDSGITGVLCMNDALASRLLRHFRRRGIEIPKHLSLIAFDDEIAEHLEPPLTAVSPERETVGFVAVQQALAMLSNGDPGPGRRLTIDPTLVIRESTAAPAG